MRSIVTVGICPCWDITCSVDGVSWGDHAKMSSQSCTPAGKALNISRALAWLGVRSTACGLWGADDYEQMLGEMASLKDFIDVRLTTAPGRTRRNVTIVDTDKAREMHLRAWSGLATSESLKDLAADLSKIAGGNSMCVFAGALPEDAMLSDVEWILRQLQTSGGKIVIDTSGKALKRVVEMGDIRLIKPNVAELCELLGRDVADNSVAIAAAAKELVDRVEIVIVSRGEKGAVAVARDFAVEGVVRQSDRKAQSTVGCGDYLLAGFIGESEELGDGFQVASALGRAIKVATAKAWGLCEKMNRQDAEKMIDVDIREL